ncbi:MAG: rhomboid family intramembrane serine protease [Ferruginibacter sp.]
MAYNYNRGFQRVTPVVLNLIIINVLVYFAQLMLDSSIELTPKLALFSLDTGLFNPYQLITHMFAHATRDADGSVVIFHILFNMLGLWMFGTNLERIWGTKRFLIFYFACGLTAGIAQMLLVTNSVSIGASGAIMGLLAAYAYYFPDAEFFFFPIPFPVKAKYFVFIVAAVDLFSGLHPGKLDDVGHYAHLGGLVMGFILVIIWNKTNKKTFY